MSKRTRIRNYDSNVVDGVNASTGKFSQRCNRSRTVRLRRSVLAATTFRTSPTPPRAAKPSVSNQLSRVTGTQKKRNNSNRTSENFIDFVRLFSYTRTEKLLALVNP